MKIFPFCFLPNGLSTNTIFKFNYGLFACLCGFRPGIPKKNVVKSCDMSQLFKEIHAVTIRYTRAANSQLPLHHDHFGHDLVYSEHDSEQDVFRSLIRSFEVSELFSLPFNNPKYLSHTLHSTIIPDALILYSGKRPLYFAHASLILSNPLPHASIIPFLRKTYKTFRHMRLHSHKSTLRNQHTMIFNILLFNLPACFLPAFCSFC